jgi:hypothetical protein
MSYSPLLIMAADVLISEDEGIRKGIRICFEFGRGGGQIEIAESMMTVEKL